MKFWKISGMCVVAAGLAVGCDQSEVETPATSESTTESGATSLEKQAMNAGEKLKAQAEEAGNKLMEQAEGEAEKLDQKAQDAAESGKQSMDDAIASGQQGLADATDNMKKQSEGMLGGLSLDNLKEGMSLNSEQADAIIAKVKEYIGNDNMELARKWVDKLDSVSLPEGYAEKVASLKDMLN